MSTLTLGGVSLQDFEIPGQVAFGGKQAMAVHKLPGGVRIIDVMGRDDTDIRWSGIMSGPDASNRARALDAMRCAGDTISLSWDVLFYQVVIADLEFVYTNPWWIPYRIACRIVADQAQLATISPVNSQDAILADLNAAMDFANVSGVIDILGSSGAFTSGTQSNISAMIALSDASASFVQDIGSAEQALESTDIPTLVSASGSLAYATAAQGYVGRAALNLENTDD